jgi:segregation and condensation protein A
MRRRHQDAASAETPPRSSRKCRLRSCTVRRFMKLPDDLYIPPDALEVFLEAFEGPLDLLLYLIRRQNLDILDIPVAEITRQYMQYVEMMHAINMELAAEYLVMAAVLG